MRKNNPDFSEIREVKFSDLFKFRGVLGQGSYGLVVSVFDKFIDHEETTSALKIISKQRLHPD